MEKHLAIAEILAYVRLNRTALAPLPPDGVPHDEADGYRVQDALHHLLSPDFGTQVGFKIGCTSAVMQRYLNFDHPCTGGLYMAGVHASGASLRFGDYVRVGVECEIAVRMGSDLLVAAEPFTADSVAPAIEAYCPAIEIVDDRYVDWRGMDAATLIADDFFAAGCVLGTAVPRTQAPDLSSVVGRAIINGTETGRGTGADVLGHPHHALAWLANHLAADGRTLRKGEFVLTGSLVQTVWLDAGDAVLMELSGLGSVAVDFKA
jgi:2-keto-4-pentenoate hydratase